MFRILLPLFLILNITTFANASQTVSGLQIDYEPKFIEDTQATKDLLLGIPQNVRQVVQSLNIFVGNTSKGISDIRLIKVKYVPELNGSIDGAATESVKRLSALNGIKNLKQTIHSTVVSGHESRRVSIKADRWGGKIGHESLIIYNQNSNTVWQMQITFGKKKGLNPFKSLKLDAEREYAKNLLATIQVIP